MSDIDLSKFPALRIFKNDLEKGALDARKIDDFDKYRIKKLAEGTPERLMADDLLDRGRKQLDGKPQAGALHQPPPAPREDRRGRGPGRQAPPRREGSQTAGRNRDAAESKCLGEPFQNPYTFLPFPVEPAPRRKPTPLTIDEFEKDRFTGTIEIELRTLSPLLTCESEPFQEFQGHRMHRALAIGDDIIVPATGVRGSLRTLLSIIVGGTLGYVDDEAWLCQGRDAKLGPRGGPMGLASTPEHCSLARVEEPGDRGHHGKVRLGETRLIRLDDLQRAAGGEGAVMACRPRPGQQPREMWVDDADLSVTSGRDDKHPWLVKLSGRPINLRGKREGLFRRSDTIVTLDRMLWAAYSGRNRHGDHPELRKGDLVWLEHEDPNHGPIRTEADAVGIKSIQWARWGRTGERLLKVIADRHSAVMPDAVNPDRLVDEVTDLFGQVPRADLAKALFKGEPAPAGPFIARVRPENLVFFDAMQGGVERSVALAPLAPPHPGCAAFYRAWNGDPAGLDSVANRDLGLRGYKVYRTTAESGRSAPWNFGVQGVYDDGGGLKDPRQRVNKSCDLLKAGQSGRLRLACRALSRREIALLLAVCSVDWRLGGGKPLGLGWCRVSSARVVDEFGNELWALERLGDELVPLPADLVGELVEDDLRRLASWQASQRPVAKLRYPRAVTENRNKKSRGGHAWFARHASPKKTGEDFPVGLETLWTDGELKTLAGAEQVRAQALPPFDPSQPNADTLYGYDLFSGDSNDFRVKASNYRTFNSKLEPFDPKKHVLGDDRSGGQQGQNRDLRRDERKKGRE